MDLSNERSEILIVGIHPYFLEKGNVWFQENLKQVLDARKTQQFFQDNTLFLEKDQQYSISELLRKLDELGYEKVLDVRSMGEFSHRGGIVEVFPVNSGNVLRVEFVGNRVDNIEPLDISEANEEQAKEILKKRLKSQKLFSDLQGLKQGDYVEHLDHGVARFTGISYLVSGILYREEEIPDTKYKLQDTKYYVLEYAENDKLFVPLGLERKLSRYVGFAEPRISRLGSPLWQKTKRKAKEEIEKLAKELLALYAQREVSSRPAYKREEEIEHQLQRTFPYQETPDQIQALHDIYEDLSRTEPMDRILCGDVGFGKTEVALRAMVHASHNGYQSALLAPTTILAHQHYQNFQARLKDLPIHVEILSRLQSKKEQARILQGLKLGSADIAVGTHRLFSKDVDFKNLGRSEEHTSELQS